MTAHFKNKPFSLETFEMEKSKAMLENIVSSFQ